jgi:tetratricopeptide (TPR) repeat protein
MGSLEQNRKVYQQSGQRFARHYLVYAQSHKADFTALDEELDNLFRASSVYSRLQAWLNVTHLVQALDNFLDTRGYWAEHRFWLEQVLDHRDALDHPSMRMEILGSLAHITSSQGDRKKAKDLYQEVIRLAEQERDEMHLARACYGLGTVYFSVGQHDGARFFWERAISIAKHIGDEALVAIIRYFLGTLNSLETSIERIDGETNLAIGLATKVAPWLGIAGKSMLAQLRAMAYFVRGQDSQAHQHYLEALELARKEGDRQGTALTLYQLGQIAHREGNFTDALNYYRQSEAITREMDDRTGLMALYSAIGLVYLQQQRFDLARPHLEQSVTLEREAGDQIKVAENLYWLGYAVANTGDLAQAEQVFEESLTIFTRLDSPRVQDVHEVLSRLRTVMSQEDG